MNNVRDEIEYVKGFHQTDRTNLVDELRRMQLRGDAIKWQDKLRLRLALHKAERELTIQNGSTPAGIALRQIIATERSAMYAFFALLISLAALAVSALAYFKPLIR